MRSVTLSCSRENPLIDSVIMLEKKAHNFAYKYSNEVSPKGVSNREFLTFVFNVVLKVSEVL